MWFYESEGNRGEKETWSEIVGKELNNKEKGKKDRTKLFPFRKSSDVLDQLSVISLIYVLSFFSLLFRFSTTTAKEGRKKEREGDVKRKSVCVYVCVCVRD